MRRGKVLKIFPKTRKHGYKEDFFDINSRYSKVVIKNYSNNHITRKKKLEKNKIYNLKKHSLIVKSTIQLMIKA